MRRLLIVAALVLAGQADADELRLHAEVDPLPFARAGYGGQIGVRDDARFGRLRLAVASFALDVPDFAAQLGGNEDFHIRVRPSAALYLLYYLSPKRNGFAVGGSLRYLRLRYTHDEVADMHDDTRELSPEAIIAYKFHPTRFGFYVQPWLGLSATLWRSHDPVVETHAYDPLAVQAFFTVNLGWELAR